MTVEAIQAAIKELPEPDRRKRVDWIEELEEQAWDKEIEKDFSAGGRGISLLEQVNREIAEGKASPLEEGFTARRKFRA
jgi:hypothetical protein